MDEERKEKDDQLSQLTAYINTMNQNFSQMLKQTLTKMKERINDANQAWEQENDQKMMEKFREIVDTGNANNL